MFLPTLSLPLVSGQHLMACRIRLIVAILGVAFALDASLCADEPTVPEFKKQVLPILRSHCVGCHGPKKQESDIRLDNLSTDLINNRAAAENWHEVLNVLNAGEMPPKKAKPLSTQQRDILTRWVSHAVKTAIQAGRRTDGRVVIRKLNRTEYQNTMSDLLQLDMNFIRDLPPDAISSEGFLNDGSSLRMSPLQLEYHLQTARTALNRVIVNGSAPKVHKYEFKASNVKNWLGNPQRSNRLGRQQQFLAKMVKDYPETGEFRVRVTLSAELKPNVGYPLLEVAVGYRPDTKILFHEFDLIEIKRTEEQTFEFRSRIENFPLPVRGQGKYPGLVVRLRNVYDDGSPLPKAQKGKGKGRNFPIASHMPTILVKSVEFQGPYFEQWPPKSHRRILFESPLSKSDESAYVTRVLERFMKRAFRRPVEKSEVAAMVAFFKSIRPNSESFEEAITETLAFVLVRPEFLYLMEPAGEQKRSLGDWELASRLSYFLWSTMPDDRLMQLAARGELAKPGVLAAEVDRLLSNPRAKHFINNFTEQWLNLNVVDSVAVSREYHPRFDSRLKNDMKQETQEFFGELLRQDASALKLLNGSFTMLNEPLAKHYGMKGIYGRTFRRVELAADQHRGGLLGHASILLSNSTGSDSHPVRRAVWIRDRLLNDPPAPPPPDVPTLDEADPKFHKLSVREQLEIHRNREACARCHRDIDPWGIALENYDAVGLWRTEIRRKSGRKFTTHPVVAKDTLPNGLELNGVNRLKKHLVEDRKRDFARSLAARMLTYGLGRKLEVYDRDAVDRLTNQFVADQFRLRGLVKKVVLSRPFRTK